LIQRCLAFIDSSGVQKTNSKEPANDRNLSSCPFVVGAGNETREETFR
jgi:hypothetical protein